MLVTIPELLLIDVDTVCDLPSINGLGIGVNNILNVVAVAGTAYCVRKLKALDREVRHGGE